MFEWLTQAIDWIQHQASMAVVYLLFPFFRFMFDGNTRYFWVYCISGVAISAYIYYHDRGKNRTSEKLFARETWLSVSAQNDYYIVSLSMLLRVTILSWLVLNAEFITGLVADGIRWLGVSGEVNNTWALMLGFALTVTLFVVDDFNKFIAHYTMHRIPEFWEFHKVHHSAEVLNFTTADRAHPFETVYLGLVNGLTIGTVNGLFIGFFGDDLTVLTVAGANIFLVAFNIFGGVLRHSPVWLSFGPKIERWFVSPAMHHIHHSEDPKHFDKNMGGTLAIWDRLFGTHYIPEGQEVKRFGLGEETKEFRSLSYIYFAPFAKSLDVAKKRLGIGERNLDGERAGQVPGANM